MRRSKPALGPSTVRCAHYARQIHRCHLLAGAAQQMGDVAQAGGITQSAEKPPVGDRPVFAFELEDISASGGTRLRASRSAFLMHDLNQEGVTLRDTM